METSELGLKRARIVHYQEEEQDEVEEWNLSDVVLTLSRQPRVTVKLRNIQSADRRVVDTEADFHELLTVEAERANRTKGK